MICTGCKYYRWVEVPAEYGGKAQMCDAGPDDECPIDEATMCEENVRPCPTCGRDIDGYSDCPDCLRVELLASEWAANERQRIQDILEAS